MPSSKRSKQPSAKQVKKPTRREILDALHKENEIARIDLIRRLLDKPMSERTHFLRKRVGIASTCI